MRYQTLLVFAVHQDDPKSARASARIGAGHPPAPHPSDLRRRRAVSGALRLRRDQRKTVVVERRPGQQGDEPRVAGHPAERRRWRAGTDRTRASSGRRAAADNSARSGRGSLEVGDHGRREPQPRALDLREPRRTSRTRPEQRISGSADRRHVTVPIKFASPSSPNPETCDHSCASARGISYGQKRRVEDRLERERIVLARRRPPFRRAGCRGCAWGR